VIAGLELGGALRAQTNDAAVRLFAHESCRVYRDVLCKDAHRETFDSLLRDVIAASFQCQLNATPAQLCFTSIHASLSLAYSEYPSKAAATDVVARSAAAQSLKSRLSSAGLVFFESAVDHVLRLARVLRLPHGHAVVVGGTGVGKRTAIQLACKLSKLPLTDFSRRPVSRTHFRDAIKSAILRAGLKVRKGFCVSLVSLSSNLRLLTPHPPSPRVRAAWCALERAT
jgi:dynein heavy chain, axonemal